MASISNTLLIIPREMPSYVSTAYSLRFSKSPANENIIQKITRVFRQYMQLLGELLFSRNSKEMFEKNVERLKVDFEAMRERLESSTRPICAYFIAPFDHNGAILGDRSYYYYHYRIENFEKHYSVAPFLTRSAQEVFETLKDLKQKYPEREIQVVDFTSHGWPQGVLLPNKPLQEGTQEEAPPYDIAAVEEDQFKDCAKDATIILDACSTGKGEGSLAEVLAKKNRGKTFFAPKRSLFFSKPIVSETNGKSRIEHVVHGFAIFNAYTAGKFLTPIAIKR